MNVDVRPLGPDLELLDRGRAKGVGGADKRLLPGAFSRFASLPTVVVFPVPLTPTIMVTLG